MLTQLTVRNYAIIQQVNVGFHPSLNVITGETGAGKSILAGALGLVLGDRADSTMLLNKNEKCFVEATFTGTAVSNTQSFLQELDIEDSIELILRREIAVSGKSRCFVNDTPVSLQVLRQVAEKVVDLHRQFDSLKAGDNNFALFVADALSGSTEIHEEYSLAYKSWKSAQQHLSNLVQQQAIAEASSDYQQYLLHELEEASFKPDELEAIEEELKLASEADNIQQTLQYASTAMQGEDAAIVPALRSVISRLQSLRTVPSAVQELIQRLSSAHIELKDIANEMEAASSQIVNSEERLQWLEQRIDMGNRLLKKHQVRSTNELLQIHSRLREQVEALNNIDDAISAAKQNESALYTSVMELGEALRSKRSEVPEPFSAHTETLLHSMGMPNARVKMEARAQEHPTPFGLDEIGLFFDANKTGRFEPLNKVASGGELSRLMLAIKSQVAKSTSLPTLIFDEIDSGISGEAARQVGLLMRSLSADHQVISITHQPQIAACSSLHLFVYKSESQGVVSTGITQLEGEERVEAIARMMSGDRLTSASLAIARQLITDAN